MRLSAHPRCKICRHEKREEINLSRVKDNLSYKAIHEKYFPNHNPKTINKTLSMHFKRHFNPSASPQIPAVSSPRGGPPHTITEKMVFDEAANSNINAVFNLMQLMRVLFDKINWLENEWQNMKTISACEHCGRADDMGPNLSKLLACIREIRELNSEWTRLQNPRDIIKKHFADTFLEFSRNCADIYTETLREKSSILRDSTNQFLKKEINEFLFARRIAELEDLGAERVGERLHIIFRGVLSDALKKLDM